MDYPKYQINFMPESYYGYCSTACFMGILNYFWYTQFNMKDTRDVMKIAKMGRYKEGIGLDTYEMGYALSKLGFRVIIGDLGSYEAQLSYINDPISYITQKHKNGKYKNFIRDGKWIDMNGNNIFDFYDTYISKKILECSEIEKLYNIDPLSFVEEYQNKNTLFILSVNWNVLYDQKPQEGISGGHVVLTTGYRNGMFEIYDPGPYKKPDFIAAEKVLEAMNDLNKTYSIIAISNLH
ncbi:MAG: hypothetical protein DLD55_04765 [candidate division SR1 bacterium]|nr:MAG: hypothetical protein DLD55_04765 [candidate division SR1 bacterium]